MERKEYLKNAVLRLVNRSYMDNEKYQEKYIKSTDIEININLFKSIVFCLNQNPSIFRFSHLEVFGAIRRNNLKYSPKIATFLKNRR